MNPNIYDSKFANTFQGYTNHVSGDCGANPKKEMLIPEEGLVLQPGRVYLGGTKKRMGSNYYVPIIHGKSSIARLELFIYVTADLMDIGL